MKDIIIIGSGGFAREVAWLVEEINLHSKSWNLIGFYDENIIKVEQLNDYKIINKSELSKYEHCYFVIGIGDSETRKDISQRYPNIKFATLIHPDVSISKTNQIGEGTIICKGSILTVNINIGNHVIINLDSTIGHDVILKDFVTILPSSNISGHVQIEECTIIGTGTQVIQEKTIGKHTIIGAGSVVTKNINEYVVAVGSPVREIRNRMDK